MTEATPNITLRLAKPEDYKAIYDLYEAIAIVTKGTDNDPFWIMGEHPSEDDITGAIEEGNLLTAWLDDGALASVAIVNHVSAKGYDNTPWETPFGREESAILHLFGVHPEFTGLGIGRKMIAYVEGFARSKGDKVLRLDTLETNLGARSMYNKLGFTDCGFVKLHYDDTDLSDFHMFEKPL